MFFELSFIVDVFAEKHGHLQTCASCLRLFASLLISAPSHGLGDAGLAARTPLPFGLLACVHSTLLVLITRSEALLVTHHRLLFVAAHMYNPTVVENWLFVVIRERRFHNNQKRATIKMKITRAALPVAIFQASWLSAP